MFRDVKLLSRHRMGKEEGGGGENNSTPGVIEIGGATWGGGQKSLKMDYTF